MIWQIVIAMLHSNGQRTETDEDTDKGCQKTCCTAEDKRRNGTSFSNVTVDYLDIINGHRLFLSQ